MKWKTKDGHYVEMSEMSDDHLLNTIRMLRKKKRKQLESNHWAPIPYTENEIHLRLNDTSNDYVELCKEARRRGLMVRSGGKIIDKGIIETEGIFREVLKKLTQRISL
jgi:hypothetical protein